MIPENNSSGFVGNNLIERQIDDDSEDFIMREELPSSGFNRMVKACRKGRWYILKGLKPEYMQPMFLRLLSKEYEIQSSLSHPAIASCESLEDVPGIGLCIIEEFVQGQTLRSFIDRRAEMSAEVFRRNAVRIARETAEAMKYMHSKQIVHRDLKPENILITDNGYNVKIIDFGFSDSDIYEILKAPAGTPKYLAPEYCSGNATDIRGDIYSFGVILSELFSDPRDTATSRRYGKIAKRCTAPLEKRPQHADDLIHILSEAETTLPFWQRPIILVPSVVIALLSLSFIFFHIYTPVPKIEGTEIPIAYLDSVAYNYPDEMRTDLTNALQRFSRDRESLSREISQSMEERSRFVKDFTPDSLSRISWDDFTISNPQGFCFRFRNEMRMLGEISGYTTTINSSKKMEETEFRRQRMLLARAIGLAYTRNSGNFFEQIPQGPLRQRIFSIYFPEKYLPILEENDAQIILEQLIPDAETRSRFVSHGARGGANAALIRVHDHYPLFQGWDLREYGYFLTHYFPKKIL